jgi:hypothetical protein
VFYFGGEKMSRVSRWIPGVIFLCLIATGVADKTVVLPEGFVLNGVEGLARKTETGSWSLVTDSDLVYMKTTLPAGSTLTILSSGGLEQIRAFAKEQNQTHVKIWGILTLYKKQNFLFPIQVLALSETTSKPAPAKSTTPKTENSETSEVIPSEIMKLLRSQSKIDLAKVGETIDTGSKDFSLISKTGFVILDKENCFLPDGFGRKTDNVRFFLLPCLTLEDTEEKLARAMGRYRYNISGIITVYEGRQYLLLYRATRTYSNRNFTP